MVMANRGGERESFFWKDGLLPIEIEMVFTLDDANYNRIAYSCRLC